MPAFKSIFLSAPKKPSALNQKLVIQAFFLCILLLTNNSALPNAASAADKVTNNTGDKSELYRLSAEMLRLAEIYTKLKNETMKEGLAEGIKKEIDGLPNEEIHKTATIIKKNISELKAEIKELKEAPVVVAKKKIALSELDILRNEYTDLRNTYQRKLEKNKPLKKIFVADPYDDYFDRYSLDPEQSSPKGKALVVHHNIIQGFKELHRQVSSITAKDIRKIQQNVGSDRRLYELNAERLPLLEAAQALSEKLEPYKRRIENNIDDAHLNCQAEEVDFNCGSRCERNVRDPILGYYRTEPDFRCLRSCQAQEQRAIDHLNSQVRDCVEIRDDAAQIVDEAKDSYTSIRSQLMSKVERIERIEAEIREMATVRKYVVELRSRLTAAIRSSLVANY